MEQNTSNLANESKLRCMIHFNTHKINPINFAPERKLLQMHIQYSQAQK